MHMAVQTNIAVIVAMDVTNLEDGIVFWALAEKCWLGLDKTSTATANSKSCWAAMGGGRWFLSRDSEVVATTAPTGAAATGTRWLHQGVGSATSYLYNGTTWVELSGGGGGTNLVIAPNIAAIKELNTTAFPDGIHYYAIAEKLTLVLDKRNSAEPNDLTVWAASDGMACWFAHPSSVIVSSSSPNAVNHARAGTTWIWAESGYEYDSTKSVVTYVWMASSSGNFWWREISSRPRFGIGSPIDNGVPMNGQLGFWFDRQTRFMYFVSPDIENGDTWEKVLT